MQKILLCMKAEVKRSKKNLVLHVGPQNALVQGRGGRGAEESVSPGDEEYEGVHRMW